MSSFEATRPVALSARQRGPIGRLLRSGVAVGFVVSAGLTTWILFGLQGWRYYGTSLAVRGYEPGHHLLRPSGPIGHTFGLVGGLLVLVPFAYMVRKRVAHGRGIGRLKTWLEIHLFCGIVGPVLVTFHTSFKFNGIISAAYWSMIVVMLSGFVGRYLYVRIPRTLRGNELTHAELDERAGDLLAELGATPGSEPWLDRVHALELDIARDRGTRLSFAGLLFGEIGLRRRIRRFAHELQRHGVPAGRRHDLARLVGDRALLLRRMAYLEKTKAAFGLWHVLHVPLVYLLLVITAIHVGVALYMGYVPFRW